MKRKILLFLAATFILLGVAYTIQSDRTIDYADFQPRFSTTVRSSGFQTVESASCSGDQVPLPLSIRCHPRRWHSDSHGQVVNGFPDSAELYKLAVDGSPTFDCFVRYVDGRASVIAIRAHTSQEPIARTLLSKLVREFPGLTITLTTNDA